MQTQRIIVICALIAIAAAGECPCGAGCPAVGNYKGACCHGNKTCETTNWTPATCTPAYGTWCPWKPAGRCGFSCNGDCSKCVSYSNSPYCQSAKANCEADCKGTWCPAESVPEVTLNATCACKPDKPCQQLNDGSCGQRVDDTGKPVAVGGQCAAGTEDCRPATDDDEFTSGSNDACSESTQSACDAASGCTWCKCAALPSKCWTKEDAAKLPAGVYVCDSTQPTFLRGAKVETA